MPRSWKNTYKKLVSMREQYEKAVEKVTATGDNEVIDFHARRMVEMAGHIILSHLLLQQASIDEEYRNSAEIYAKVRRSAECRCGDLHRLLLRR